MNYGMTLTLVNALSRGLVKPRRMFPSPPDPPKPEPAKLIAFPDQKPRYSPSSELYAKWLSGRASECGIPASEFHRQMRRAKDRAKRTGQPFALRPFMESVKQKRDAI